MQIKDVPSDVHRVLKRRAAVAGQSLQEFLLAHLTDYARKPTLDEVFKTIEQRTGGDISTAFAVEAQRADRDSR
jgi:hypothetical protein